MKKSLCIVLVLGLLCLCGCSLRWWEEPIQPTEAPATEPVWFSPEITFSSEYVTPEGVMPYALFTPSSAQDGEKLPLILFLHGVGECGVMPNLFMTAGLPRAMSSWPLEGFHAYVVCPQMTGAWNVGYWNSPQMLENIQMLLKHMGEQYPVDLDNVILIGFSAGGMGATYFVQEAPELFRKLVIMSSPGMGCEDLSAIQIPTIGCSEEAVAGNSFMRGMFSATFGAESVRYYNVTHGWLPDAAFHDDSDGNGRSDLVEWMLLD